MGSTKIRPALDRILEAIVVDERGCWIWPGGTNEKGYGMITEGRRGHHRIRRVHKVVYEELVGPVPKGLQLDHECENKRCCRPQFGPDDGCVRPLTARANVLRTPTTASAVNAAKTHCRHGHALTEDNVWRPPKHPTHRVCRKCLRARLNAYRERKRNA